MRSWQPPIANGLTHRLLLTFPTAHLLEQARTQFSKRSLRDGIPAGHRVVNYYQVGLEQFEPEQGRYDMIWVQWALLYLTDGACGCVDAVGLSGVTLVRCSQARLQGMIARIAVIISLYDHLAPSSLLPSHRR